jgi:hypothetical protein
MAVSQVIRLQAAPGRFGDLLELSQKLQKIRERLAPESKTRRFVPASGNVTGALIVVIEFADFKQYGEYAERLANDPEARALQQSNRADRNPVAVSQTIELVREL